MQWSLRRLATSPLVIEVLFGCLVGLLGWSFARATVEELRRERDVPLALLGPDFLGTKRAPDFELRDRFGRAHRLSDYRGRAVVLNFWSITCRQCVQEMPSLEWLDRVARAEGDIAVVTVTVDDGWGEVARVFPGGTDLLVLFDPEREVVERRYGTRLYPETWLIDRRGRIRARFDGQRDWTSPVVLDVLQGL